ncbi:MAG: DUF4352 domain-containing protein [Anaerolineae bacterium]|nr:DUF4352 domain-containing protein [Anaerolineae bacterium]
MKRTKVPLVVVACALLLDVGAGGCCCCLPSRSLSEAVSETAAAAAAICAVGQRCESAGISLTVYGVSRREEIDGSMPAPSGGTFLVLSVTVENLGRDRASYSPLFFHVGNPGGVTCTGILVAPAPELGSGELAAGERASGNVAFEIDRAAGNLMVLYQPPELVGRDPIRINLGR